MLSGIPDDEPLSFIDEPELPEGGDLPVWRILVVDDEPDVHEATLLALKDMQIEGRGLAFVHAYSAGEARACLTQYDDLAVVLLDVVMESDDAGLRLVRFIRDELGNRAMRVILRTGQPGYAPEIDTIQLYDINDYKTKSELTRVRLFTSLTVAIRSYWQIHQLEASRRGLALIVGAGNELSKPRGLQRFAEGVVTQLCALLGIGEEGLVCAVDGDFGRPPTVLAAAGCYAGWMGRSLDDISDRRVREELEKVFSGRSHQFGEATCLYFGGTGNQALAAFVDVRHPLSTLDRNLLEVFCSNISVGFENMQLYRRISNLAFEDGLVKLPNRNSLLTLIDQRPSEADTLALVDIDGFADINSILDQSFGDAVLVAVATRLRQMFPPTVVVARVGSDVFSVLGPATEITPESIAHIFSAPFTVDAENLRLSATAGLVNLSDSSFKGVELLKNAAVSLKLAKNFSRGKSLYFEPAHANSARERMQLLSQLRQAFSAERLFPVYQPFVDLASGRFVGAEVLLRWRTEEGAFVPPDRFIPLAEQSGLMVAIGDWVMRSAFQFLARLAAVGLTDFRMAINVSHVQFREPDFVDRLVSAMAEYKVSPANVEIELTESVAIDNIELIGKKLAAVRAAGVAIAIDDFGTGYSSLNIIRQLNVDRLKIDRAFVSGEGSSDDHYGIAHMVIQLAEQLGLETIAEGIETDAQRDSLLAMGCRDGQGYLFSRPLPAEEFLALLRT
ncbi:EAL domain-containing protein [Dechloromonas denitrificans]|uniref:GGDEF/EAL domain-containing response regulator n=1 Tax=Dechloromonas denitrificans TaxID=281362 RepID=UPI001CF8F818|nr:EAL domain-containing protein [Dechloromonas denitrificans]UCV10331.1 EAL domain-containing protein [Dechloromonas denitrificans]